MKCLGLITMAQTHVILGVVDGSLGISLAFLQDLFSAPLETVSSLFVFFGIGDALSIVCFSLIVKKCDVFLLMAICSLVAGLGIAMVPLTSVLAAGLVAMVVYGMATGLLHCGPYHLGNVLFAGQAYVFHILSASYSTGTFLGPILVDQVLRGTLQIHNATFNASADFLQYGSLNRTDTDISETIAEKHIGVARHLYFVFGLLYTAPLLMCIIAFLQARNEKYASLEEDQKIDEPTQNKPWELVFSLLNFTLLTISHGSPFAYGSYIASVTTMGSFQVMISKAVLMTTVFWLCLLFGGFWPVGMSLCISQMTLMYVSLFGSMAAISSVLWAYSSSQETVFWFGSMAYALFQGPIFATVVSWSAKRVNLTPKIIMLYMIADSIGTLLLPYIDGVVIGYLGTKAHFYLHFFLVIFQSMLFVSNHLIGCRMLLVY